MEIVLFIYNLGGGAHKQINIFFIVFYTHFDLSCLFVQHPNIFHTFCKIIFNCLITLRTFDVFF